MGGSRGYAPFRALTSTEQFIALTGAVDVRGKLPVRQGAGVYPARNPTEQGNAAWLVFHHTGKVGEPTAEAVAAYQVGPTAQEEFPAIAYHLFVERDGTIKVCHDLTTVCWANGPGSPIEKQGIGIFNWWTIACCFSGNNPTEVQITAMKKVADTLDECEHRMERTCHRLVCVNPKTHQALTECPGDDYKVWLPRVQVRS